MSNIPWVIKYRPKRIAEVENQDDAKRKFVAWLQSWLKGRPTKKAALLYGPPGSGKTSLVEAAAKEYNLELIEMNASDFRRRKDIERVAKIAASQMSLFSKKGKIILLDEVDGISGRADAGGLEAILELIKLTRHPIVMTANDPWDPRLRSLREESVLIEFKRLPKTTIINVLKKICLAEGLKCDYNALSYLAEKSEGDLRSAINDLEAIGRVHNHVTLALVKAMVRPRDREHTPFEALRNLFTSRYVWQAKMAIMQTNVDYETMMQWINENIPYQLTDSEDLWRAYESLSRADQYFGRIKKSGSWDLLAYVFDLMGPGVALARKKTRYKWVRYSFPQKILLMSKTKQVREIRDALARHIASRILTSSAIVKSDVLPYLKVIFENNPLYAARLAIGLELTESMIKYLAGPKASEVISYVRRLKSGKIPPSMIKRIK